MPGDSFEPPRPEPPGELSATTLPLPPSAKRGRVERGRTPPRPPTRAALVCAASIGAALLIAVLGSAAPAWCCDTPVYRYALYRWRPAPFELYYFHDQAIDPADAAWQAEARRWAEADRPQTNLAVLPVDLGDPTALSQLPADVRRAWEKQTRPQLPGLRLFSPQGALLDASALRILGAVEAPPAPVSQESDSLRAELQALVDSPTRRAIAAQLAEGKACVFVLLRGQDEKANANIRALIAELADDLRAGKIQLYEKTPEVLFPRLDTDPKANTVPPANNIPPANTGEAAPPSQRKSPEEAEKAEGADKVKGADKADGAGPPPLEIGFVELGHGDLAERWLVRTLLSAEDDLRELAAQPMVFTVYGRGRALPPYVGAGVTRENLLADVEFLTGPCSCTVKEQNPGFDLLTQYDWDRVSAQVAEKFGAEEGNETQLGVGEFFPNLLLAPASEGSATPSDAPVDGNSSANAKNAGNGQTSEASHSKKAVGEGSSAVSGDKTPSNAPTIVPAPAVPSADEVALASEPTQGKNANVTRQVARASWFGFWTVATGLATLLVALIGLTYWVLRTGGSQTP